MILETAEYMMYDVRTLSIPFQYGHRHNQVDDRLTACFEEVMNTISKEELYHALLKEDHIATLCSTSRRISRISASLTFSN